jgi:hypothetical protein
MSDIPAKESNTPNDQSTSEEHVKNDEAPTQNLEHSATKIANAWRYHR